LAGANEFNSLSRQAISEEGLHLLASVETYLLETRAMRLKIIGSE
jgi:hypothetical protein